MNKELLFKEQIYTYAILRSNTGSKFLYDGENANLSIVSSNKRYAFIIEKEGIICGKAAIH